MVKILKNSSDYSSIIRFPYLVLAVSILLTIGITYSFYQSARNIDSVRFTNEVNRIQSTLENKIDSYTSLLSGGRGFIESTEKLTRKNFAGYVKSLETGKNYAGIEGIGFSKIVSAGESEDFAKKMKSEGFTDFQKSPELLKKTFQTVMYFEPVTASKENQIGFDLSMEANRQIAMERAEETGKPTASGKINLLGADDKGETENGFIIFLPIYKQGNVPQAVEEKKKIEGFIYIPFRAEDFLHEIENDTMRESIALKIYDGEPSNKNLLVQTENQEDQNSNNSLEGIHSATKNLNVAGRKWTIEYASLPFFAQQSSLGWTPLIFISGMVFSFLLFGMTYWEASARVNLEQTAGELFEAEKQKQDLLEKEQKARKAAEKANTAKDQFISVVSHELRTPLNAISGWARILKNSAITENTKNQAIEKIEKNLRSQTKLVKDLIDYTQIISGSYDFEGNDVNFSEIFEKTFIEIEPAALEKQIEFFKENNLNGHRVLGDEDRIKIVIYNLLTNAVKFTNRGGRVEARIREKNGSIEMSIKDSGKGISSEYLPYIFERFSQSDSTITRTFGGMGLGLSVSNHIVKLHNGSIEAKSEGIGKGSEFIVRFPYK